MSQCIFALARAKPAIRRSLLPLLAGTLSGAVVGPGSVLAVGAQRAPNPVFKPLLGKLKQSHVPLILPSWILPVSPVYATIEILKPGHYYVALGYTRDCHEATACNIGAVEGQKVTAVPHVDRDPEGRIPEVGRVGGGVELILNPVPV